MAMDLGAPSSGKKGRHSPSMNVTPLVDVVLVLLIIFMVVTPMLSKQFWLHLPNKPDKEEPQPETPSDKQPIVVSVTIKGDIKINSEVVPKDVFPGRLKRALAAAGERTVFFDAHDEAEFGHTVEAMDLARAGGAATIVVLTAALPQH